MTITYRISGPMACWTRPDLHVERVSYPVPTPAAIQGVTGAIHAKPEFIWRIHEIRVMSPLVWSTISHNEISTKGRTTGPESKHRMQRTSRILLNVDYIVTVSPVPAPDAWQSCDLRVKHSEILRRRLTRGDYYRQPALGMSNYLASDIELIDGEIPVSPLRGRYDLGTTYHSMDWDTQTRRWYRPEMVNGVIAVPDLWTPTELCNA